MDSVFKPVSSQVDFSSVEKEVLSFWESNKVFAKSLELTKDKKPFSFYDGPPFATGLPHYGHLLAGTLKDIVPRYWTMRGNYVERRFGWDCHGLPVENEVEKAYGISKHNIEDEWGIDLFNEICRSIVLRYTSEWRQVVERMGRWVDFDNQYRTMDPQYMESIWWVFKQVWDKGLIYNGFRVQPYCPRCATPLSNFEVNEGYKDIKGPSITVTFPLVDDPTTKILVWTTTPWTLPSNVALAAGPKISYVKVHDGDNTFIIAKDRLGAYYHKPEEYRIIDEFPGTKLAGLRYQPMFEYFKGVSPDFFQVTTADFVSTEDGTGIVHIAPAFGEDDFAVGQKMKLPIVCPVDAEGKFTAEVPEWAGKLVFDADEEITRNIKSRGRLIHRGHVQHRYPFCYRCDSPLIYKTISTWFMKIEPLKPNMLQNNQQIRWVPDHLKNGRFGKGIESAPDWNISRNRYWGTPLPVWKCACGHVECLGDLKRLHELMGDGNESKGKQLHDETVKKVKEVTQKKRAALKSNTGETQDSKNFADIPENDLHRHVVDELKLTCPKCRKQIMQRTSEVLDCWFESGSMPYAQGHYPFERRKEFEASFPADFIAEGVDQTRGWFYTLTVLASALFSKPAFKNVIVNGIILAEDGKKLSKRLRNYVPVNEIIEKTGADALRLFLINSPAVKAEDLRFSEKSVLEMTRAVLIPFWNAYSFFVTYANVDQWKPGADIKPVSTHELDQWIVSLLNDVIASVNEEMESYNLYKVVPLLVDFIDNLTNWYIRRSRRRFWKSENDTDKNSAYSTLYYVLVTFARVMAPCLPFLPEAIYRNLVGEMRKDKGIVSVHLEAYPQPVKEFINRDLETKMRMVRQCVTMGHALRARYTLKTRQPLAEATIVIRSKDLRELLADSVQLISDELNVKKVIFSGNEDDVVHLSAKANFKKLGPMFGPQMKEAAKVIEGFVLADIHSLEAGKTIPVLGKEIKLDDIELRRTRKAGVELETDGDLTVALNTELTPALVAEGIAREFVNRIQNIRKKSDFNVTDRITVKACVPREMADAITKNRDYVCSETLTQSLDMVASLDNGEEIEVNEMKGTVSVGRIKK